MKFLLVCFTILSALLAAEAYTCPPRVPCGRTYYNQRLTWYDTADQADNGGDRGACGPLITSRRYKGYPIVAISVQLFYNSGANWCGTLVDITNQGKKVRAVILDGCGNCPKYALDLDIQAFRTIGSVNTGVYNRMQWKTVGRVTGNWQL